MSETKRPVALVTGVGRRAGIGAGIAQRLAATGWDIAFTFLSRYDDDKPWGPDAEAREEITALLDKEGARVFSVEGDFEDVAAPAEVFRATNEALGSVQALVMSHCEQRDSGIRDTSIESFDRHFAVNTRASWLLIKAFAEQYSAPFGDGRIIALTSDHTAGNLPYGASKGALDRIVLAAAAELSDLGITANAINPGPINTGWMAQDVVDLFASQNPLKRPGRPRDTANLVAFLCSPEGGWINSQLLHSNGGWQH